MSDVYCNPEAFDMTVIGSAEQLDMSYEFNIFCVWKDEEGQLYYAADSGCSCPSPFEDYTSRDHLTKGSVAEIHKALDDWAPSSSDAANLHEVLAAL